MKITVLCENETSESAWDTCSSEWGLSLYIETGRTNILFDAGRTDIFSKNAKTLGIDLDRTDFIVLSHHHLDHINGLYHVPFLDRKKVILHPQVPDKIGTQNSDTLFRNYEIVTSESPLEFHPGIFFLGTIPRTNSFEKGSFEDDEMLDDSALAIKTGQGTVVITGCSHSGICNICEYAKKITQQDLYAVIGGFHLFLEESEIEDTLNYFAAENPDIIAPMHCIDLPSLAAFYNRFHIKKYGTGNTIEFPDNINSVP